MIEISETTAFMLYLCLTLGSVLGLWLQQHYSKKNRKINLNEEQLYICEYCQFCYLENQVKPVTRCPQCQSYNKQEY
ncbi:MAG: hypothetical protein ACXU9U_05945 [Parachlamydiaceae bacterium]